MGLKKFTFDEVKWTDEDKEAYSWCINHGVTIGALATVAGFQCKSWVLEVTANGKKTTSPKEYGPDDLYDKMFELYRFYYDKYN